MSAASSLLRESREASGVEHVRRMKWQRHGTLLTAPPSMKNHTATLFRNDLIVFGGFDGTSNNNRVHAMNVDTGEWRVVEGIEGISPAGRNGHTATLANGRIYYIGGWLGTGPLGAADVHALDPITWTWSRVTTSGQGPGPCNMHTADYIELDADRKLIFLFRGGDGRSYLNDLHTLDVERLVWEHPQTKGKPPAPRANHSSAVYNRDLIIFGGWDGTSRLHDMHVLDAMTLTWSCPETKGIPPTPRAGSTLTCIGDGLILFGGSGPHSSCFNDVHFFDPRTMTWTKAEKDNSSLATLAAGDSSSLVMPKKLARADATGRRRPDASLLEMADEDNPNVQHTTLAPSAKLWIQGEPPEKRAGHTATLVGNRKLLIVGGSFQTEYLKYVYELDVEPPPLLALTTPAPSVALVREVEQFYDNEELSDVVFVVENVRIYCHRIILASQSEWFKVIFSRGFKEAQEKEITLDSVPLTVFKQLIAFCYMGEKAIPFLSPNAGAAENATINAQSATTKFPLHDVQDDSLENSQDSEVNMTMMGAMAKSGMSGGARTRRTSDPRAPDGMHDAGEEASEEESLLSSLCDLYLLADQFMCEHLRERCELTLARKVNERNVKQLLSFARVNRAGVLVEVCEHFEKWGRS